MIRFYAPGLPDDTVLPESDSGHAVRVLRLHEGDSLQAVDGRGGLYDCRLVDAHPKRAIVAVENRTELPPAWEGRITVAVAPTKNLDRMEWLVEKLTEVGIDRFVPVLTARSERRVLKTERLEKIAVSAMKQSLKATLPEIWEMTPIDEFIAKTASESAQRFVGYCDENYPLLSMAAEMKPNTPTIILIGPEGDFTADEISRVVAAGFVPSTLGRNRLRTETATLYAAVARHTIDALAD